MASFTMSYLFVTELLCLSGRHLFCQTQNELSSCFWKTRRSNGWVWEVLKGRHAGKSFLIRVIRVSGADGGGKRWQLSHSHYSCRKKTLAPSQPWLSFVMTDPFSCAEKAENSFYAPHEWVSDENLRNQTLFYCNFLNEVVLVFNVFKTFQIRRCSVLTIRPAYIEMQNPPLVSCDKNTEFIWAGVGRVKRHYDDILREIQGWGGGGCSRASLTGLQETWVRPTVMTCLSSFHCSPTNIFLMTSCSSPLLQHFRLMLLSQLFNYAYILVAY